MHAVLQSPQLDTDEKSRHPDGQQLALPVHAGPPWQWQAVPSQVSLALHSTPQPPQFARSVSATQVPPQHSCDAVHAVPPQ